MMLEGPLDLVTLDGRVARASKALDRERARLATEEGREEARAPRLWLRGTRRSRARHFRYGALGNREQG